MTIDSLFSTDYKVSVKGGIGPFTVMDSTMYLMYKIQSINIGNMFNEHVADSGESL